MRSDRPPMRRTLLVPVLVLVLGVAAIAAIVELQAQAHDSAQAQLKLARAETALGALQTAPFRASETTGGSPEIARDLINRGEHKIDETITDLQRSSSPAALRRVSTPLHQNYATLERIFALGVAGGYGRAADRLSAVAARQAGEVRHEIMLANRAYKQRSGSAEIRATIGSAVVILLLVAGFGLLYRRSVGARTIAERLVVENGRLLAVSRVEALTDSLTALPNRRALRRDLERIFNAGGDERDHVFALFDLDGFKQYNDTFGHPAGDALLNRLGTRLSAAMDGQGTAYRGDG